jgi:hypothetical protein
MRPGSPRVWGRAALFLASAAVAVTATGSVALAHDGNRGPGREGDRGRARQTLVIEPRDAVELRDRIERDDRIRDDIERNRPAIQPAATPQVVADAITGFLGLPGEVQAQDVLTLRTLRELSAVLSTPEALARLGDGFTTSAVTPDMLGSVPIAQLVDFGLLVGQTPQQIVDIFSLSLLDDNRHGDD